MKNLLQYVESVELSSITPPTSFSANRTDVAHSHAKLTSHLYQFSQRADV